MVSPFVRKRETAKGMTSTTCAICRKMVALSTNSNLLDMAEQAHNCRAWHKESVEGAITPSAEMPPCRQK